MSKTLGGTIFIHNSISQGYCIKESVDCLKALCDEIIVVDAGSTDGTTDLVKSFANNKTQVVCCSNEEWKEKQSVLKQEVLAYYTNFAASFLSTEWHYNQQADEVLHQDCFEDVRKIIEEDAQGFWARRYNLWGNSQHYLDVDESRKPVGDVVLRLARTGYQSVVDAQSLHVPDARWDYLNKLRIYHFGFVRNKYLHCGKIKHMMENVFGWDNDKRVEEMNNVFDPFVHFSKDDLKEIIEPLPIFAEKWAEDVDKINGFEI